MSRKRTRHLGMSEADRLARRSSIGGSDARIIMSGDPQAVEKLWMEKRGSVEPEDLSEVILINLGNLTEPLNLDLFEDSTGWIVTDEQLKLHHPDVPFIHTTLDGLVRRTEQDDPFAVLEAKFMMPFNWSPEKALEKYWPQLQHNMLVTGHESAFLSILTGSAQYTHIPVEADMFYQSRLLQAEEAFWECVQSGRMPGAPEVAVEIPPLDQMRVVNMEKDNAWVDLAITLLETRLHADRYEDAEKKIKKLMPKDAREASGRGVKITRAKNNRLNIKLDEKAIEVAVADALARNAA